MKTSILALVCAGLAGSAFAQSQPSLPQPGPEHKQLEIWCGDWTYEATTEASPLGPAGRVVGLYSAQPALGGMVVEFRGEETGPAGTLKWTETDTYDPITKQYRWVDFASDGSFSQYNYQMKDGVATFTGGMTVGGKNVSIRGTITFSPDRMSTTQKREYSLDGKTWKPLSEGRASKLQAALAVSDDPAPELIQMERAWAGASVRADIAALDDLLADEVIFSSTDGRTQNKAEYLDDYRSGRFVSHSELQDNIEVRAYGNTAVVTGRTAFTGRVNGADATGTYQWTDTWVKRDGRWLCVASHASKVTP